MQNELDTRRKEAEKVTLIGSAVDLFLGVTKLVVGFFANSAALIADGVHSLSDLATDFMVIAVLRISHQEPDEDHPWGHGRFETVGTTALGVVLILVGLGMAYELISNLFSGVPAEVPTWPALVVAAISIISKEWIFRYSLAVGKRLKSDLLIANAWHSRTDALSSIVVFVALIGAMLGWVWLDAVAAVLVAGLVTKIGWGLVKRSLTELVDTALPEEQAAEFRAVVNEVEGIINVHDFKSRPMGSQIILEMHLQVAPHLSASEGHYLGDQAVCALTEAFPEISQVIFHIDTYNDEHLDELSCPIMPTRGTIREAVDAALNDAVGSSSGYQLQLYYSPKKVDLEIRLLPAMQPLLDEKSLTPSQLKQALKETLSKHSWLHHLEVLVVAQ